MVKSQTTSITPATHAASHASGGTDPIVADALNAQTPSAHASGHETGGADVITRDKYDAAEFSTVILDDSASGNHDTSAGAYTLLVEKTLGIEVGRTISLGITFTLSEVNNNGASFGRIYRNGGAVGTERQVTGVGADLTSSQVIAGWSNGDLLQIYGYQNNGQVARVFDLKVYGGGIILENPTWS